MANFDFSHALMNTTSIVDKEDFFRSGLPEMTSLKSLMTVASRVFKIPTTGIVLGVLDDMPRVYCISLFESASLKVSLGKIFYLPVQKRLEIYDLENSSVPLYMWIKKKIQFSRTSTLEQRVESHKIFNALVNAISI